MEKESKEKSQKRSKVFYINMFLSVVAILLLVNTFSPEGHKLIERALATANVITSNGTGTLNKLIRFASATDSTFVGDSIIYDNGTNVGIGKTPTYKLDVNGTVNASGFLLNGGALSSSQWITTGSNIYYNTGNVGIGTTTPGQKLTVSGNILATGNIYPNNQTTYGIIGNDGYFDTINTGSAGDPLEINYKTAGPVKICATAGCATTTAYFNTNGYVGLGTLAPGVKLEVIGSIRGNQAGAIRIDSGTGYVDIGPQNASYSHFQSDRPSFYFNPGIQVDGPLGAYGGGWSATKAGTITAAQFVGGGAGITGISATTATTLIGDQTNWASYRTTAVANMLSWKNYGNSHVIFDASQSTSPTGSAVNNTNSQVAWSATYPTLMGWNGGSTYGVRVDSARVADSATTAITAGQATNATNVNGGVVVTSNAASTWGDIRTGSIDSNTVYAYNRMCVGNGSGYCDSPGGTIITSSSVISPAFVGNGTAISLGTSALGDVLDSNTAWGTYLKGSGGVGIGFQVVGGTTAMWISPIGNVGIGFGPVNSGYRLEVSGDSVFRGGVFTNATGWLSDIRLKKNIQPIVRSIDILSKINGKSFEWRKEEFPTQNLPSGLRYGMIAQDVEKVLPSVVTTMKDGFKTIDYSAFTPFLIEATKELNTKNTELQTELSDQKIKYSELEARLNKLEKAKLIKN